MKIYSGQKGLTLHELVIAMSITAILLALATPSFTQFLSKRKVSGATNLVAMYLENIKMLSIRRNEFITVSLQKSEDGTQWCIGATLGNASPCDCMAEEPECLIDSDPMVIANDSYGEFAEVRTEFEPSSLTFDPVRGILTNPTAATELGFEHVSEPFRVNVSINPTGTVRKCSPTSALVVGYPECT